MKLILVFNLYQKSNDFRNLFWVCCILFLEIAPKIKTGSKIMLSVEPVICYIRSANLLFATVNKYSENY